MTCLARLDRQSQRRRHSQFLLNLNCINPIRKEVDTLCGALWGHPLTQTTRELIPTDVSTSTAQTNPKAWTSLYAPYVEPVASMLGDYFTPREMSSVEELPGLLAKTAEAMSGPPAYSA